MRSFIGAALVVTIATSLCACTEPESTDVLDPQDEPTLETRGGRGSTGTNKLSNDEFIPLQQTLARVARLYPLLDPSTGNVNEKIQVELIDQKGGSNVFHYAVACAVPDGVKVHTPTESFTGRGHLINGPAWFNAPLPHATINELMACMAAHVNAWNVEVEILLLGADVQDDPIDNPAFSVSEALWKADVNSDDVPFYTVWPAKYVAQACVDVLSAFKDRVCGQWSTGCNFTVGQPGVCFPTLQIPGQPDGDYSCNGVPVIETRLAPADLGFLYPGCRN